MYLFQLIKTSPVFIYCVNIRMGTHQFTQRKRKCARACAEIRPYTAKRQIRWLEEVDVVAVIHSEINGIIIISEKSMITNHPATRETVRVELEATRATFHALLASLTEENLRWRSHNPGWTNGEILAHMTFGFIVINVLLPMARMWGRLPKGSSKWFA